MALSHKTEEHMGLGTKGGSRYDSFVMNLGALGTAMLEILVSKGSTPCKGITKAPLELQGTATT